MTQEIGKLRELKVQPGDVVVMVDDKDQEHLHCIAAPPRNTGIYADHWDFDSAILRNEIVRIISRARPPVDLTAIREPFGLLDAATQEALRKHGGPYQVFNSMGEWTGLPHPGWNLSTAYRVKPAPKVETVILHGCSYEWGQADKPCGADTHRITFDMINGKPDCATIKMEAL